MSDDNEPSIGPPTNQVTAGTDLTGLGKLADSKLANSVYEDAVRPAAKEAGYLAGDLTYTARHILGRMLALGRDRFDRWFAWITEQVPQVRQREIPPEIAVPTIGGLSVLEEGNPLALLYLELLKKAIDKDVPAEELHPAFPSIIAQMSPLEAEILHHASKRPDYPLATRKSLEPNLHSSATSYTAAIGHLEALGLLRWTADRPRVTPNYNHTRVDYFESLYISPFGWAFFRACVPENFLAADDEPSPANSSA